MYNENIFSKKLKSLRKEFKISQRDLAKELNIGSGVISDIERGQRNPSERVACKLANKFNTSPEYWLNEELEIEKMIKESPFKQLVDGIEQLIDDDLISTAKDFDDPEISEIILDLVKVCYKKKKMQDSRK